MGTDIHTLVQVKREDKWETVDIDIDGCGRNYDTFAVLVNVRNGTGFAGCPTGEGWEPISDPKGLPENLNLPYYGGMCDSVITGLAGEDKYHWLGDHSHSFLSLKEMKDYKPPFQYKTHGIIKLEQYLELVNDKKTPEGWYGDISGPHIKVSTPENITSETTHVRSSWYRPIKEVLWLFFDMLERIEEIKKEEGIKCDTDIRLVFGFDS